MLMCPIIFRACFSEDNKHRTHKILRMKTLSQKHGICLPKSKTLKLSKYVQENGLDSLLCCESSPFP